MFPADPEMWRSTKGGTRAWLEGNHQSPLPSYLDAKEKQRITDALLTGGMRSPLLWYNLTTSGMRAVEDESMINPCSLVSGLTSLSSNPQVFLLHSQACVCGSGYQGLHLPCRYADRDGRGSLPAANSQEIR
jgi:hypothetical protein